MTARKTTIYVFGRASGPTADFTALARPGGLGLLVAHDLADERSTMPPCWSS